MDPAEEIRTTGYCVLRNMLGDDELSTLRQAFSDSGAGHTEHVDIDATTPHADIWFALMHRAPFRSLVVEMIGTDFDTLVHGRNPCRGGGQQGLHADQPYAKVGDSFPSGQRQFCVVPGTQNHRAAALPGKANPTDGGFVL